MLIDDDVLMILCTNDVGSGNKKLNLFRKFDYIIYMEFGVVLSRFYLKDLFKKKVEMAKMKLLK